MSKIDVVSGWHQPRGEIDLMQRVWTAAREEIPKVLELLPSGRRRTVVQAGGHTGVWPMLLSLHMDTVYTFEPDWTNFQCLVANVGNCPAIFPMRAALGAEMEQRAMAVAEKSGSHQVLSDREGKVPVIPLDLLNFECVDLICLDIETFELQALRGAHDTIMHCSPVILLEATGLDPADGRNEYYKDKADWLLDAGYRETLTINKDRVWIRA